MIRLLLLLASFALSAALAGALWPRRGPWRAGLLLPLAGRGGPRWVDHCVGLALGCTFTAIVLASAGSLGFMRDEGMYFYASKSYAGWFEILLAADPKVRATAYTKDIVDRY